MAAVSRGTNCGGTCTDITSPACSCTAPNLRWSSDVFLQYLPFAWFVSFYNGYLFPDYRSMRYDVRAVRGGLDPNRGMGGS